jgi:hypothetical protein
VWAGVPFLRVLRDLLFNSFLSNGDLVRTNLFRLAVAGGLFFLVWSGLGQMGYRAGQLVTLGPAELDPELVRGLSAALAAILGGSLAKLPMLPLVRETLVELGLASPLSKDEQRELFERVKRIEDTVTTKG